MTNPKLTASIEWFALSNDECEHVLSVSLLPYYVYTGVKVSKYTHYTHKLVDKAFYSVDKDTVSL